MFRLLEKIAHDNGFTVEDSVEVEKRRLAGYLPNVETHRKLNGTIYGSCVRFVDLLIKRYRTLEEAIAAGERGEAFIAQAVRARGNNHGGMVGWLRRFFSEIAACSHVKILEAFGIMEKMGVIACDSNGRGNVGYIRINVPSLLVLMALTEDVLDLTPKGDHDARAIADQTYSGFSDEEMAGFTARIEEQFQPPEHEVPAIAKINKSRWVQFFGYNPRRKDTEYQYPTELAEFIEGAWAAIAKVAKPIINIPCELFEETQKYCKQRAKVTIKRVKYLARTLRNELAYQADLDCPF